MSIKTKVQSAILNWLGIPIQLTDSEFWKTWNVKKSAAGQTVDECTVMSLSAAWACTRLISESIGTLPLSLYQKTDSGRIPATNHNLYSILHDSPNSESTTSTLLESTTASILLRGNAFLRKQFFNGRMVGLKFIPPSRLGRKVDASGKVQIHYIEDDGAMTPIPDRELFHIPGFSLDGKWGLSAIEYGAGVFGSALAAAEAANSTFENGLMPSVAFTMEKVLTKEQRTDFRENFAAISGAVSAGKPALLEGGMTADPIGIKPSDAQLLESRQYSVEEVCRWFRVDPTMVGHGENASNWGTGLEQKMIGFIVFTLRPWLTRIEQAINKSLLTPVERQTYYAEFNIEGLLRGDSAARATFYGVMVDHGLMTRDEVRQRENLPARGGNADVLTVQSAMAPLDSIGSNNSGDAARAALAAWLNDKEPKNGGDDV